MGLRPGDQIASLNASNLGMAMWAHLAQRSDYCGGLLLAWTTGRWLRTTSGMQIL